MPSQRKRVQNTVRATGTLRAAIYCRVSTTSQAIDGTSLESQLDNCREHCDRNGWVTLPEPFVDGGVSGALASRPQLDTMVALAERGEIDVVVVSRLDRLGRSVLHLATLVQRLDELGVRVIVVSGGVDTSTPTGRLLLTILGALAEFERVLIQERTTEGLHRRAVEGAYVASVAPYGYRRVGTGRDARLEVDETQAQAIKMIYERLIVGQDSMADLVRTLNEAGLAPQQDGKWNVARLSRWIRGSVASTAAGVWQYGDTRVEVPPILAQHEADAWTAWLADRDAQKSIRHSTYLLSGMVNMPCGGSATGRTAKTKARAQSPIYACLDHLARRADDPEQCDCRNVLVDALDKAVWAKVASALTDPTALAALSSDDTGGIDIGGDTLETRLAEVTARLEETRERAASEYKAAVMDGFDALTAREMVSYLRDDIAVQDAERGRLALALAQTRRARRSKTETDEAAARVAQAITNLDRDGRRAVLLAAGTDVRITGYEECSACSGRGYAGRGSDGAPAPCQVCCRMRVLPIVKVTVTLPEALLVAREELAAAV
jgi:DNA invertase Pin-like site-specific DNA recombinase